MQKQITDISIATNPNELHKYIFCLDANNLYGYAMSQYLPVGDYQWNNDDWTVERILNLKDDWIYF